jgi:hypothetical protein
VLREGCASADWHHRTAAVPGYAIDSSLRTRTARASFASSTRRSNLRPTAAHPRKVSPQLNTGNPGFLDHLVRKALE